MSAQTRVEDNDPGVVYGGLWSADPLAEASGGMRHGAARPGVTVQLQFHGTEIEVWGILDRYVDTAQPTTDYNIDGEHVFTYHAPFTTDRMFNILFFKSNHLSLGDHTITITNVNGTSPNIFWLDYFIVNGTTSQTVSTDQSTTNTPAPPVTSTTSAPELPIKSSPNAPPPPTHSSQPITTSVPVLTKTFQSSTTHAVSNTPSDGEIPVSTSTRLVVTSSHDHTDGPQSQSTSTSPVSIQTGNVAPESTSNRASIIGGAVGGAVSLVLVGVILFLVHKLRRRDIDIEDTTAPSVAAETMSFTGTAFTGPSHAHRRHYHSDYHPYSYTGSSISHSTKYGSRSSMSRTSSARSPYRRPYAYASPSSGHGKRSRERGRRRSPEYVPELPTPMSPPEMEMEMEMETEIEESRASVYSQQTERELSAHERLPSLHIDTSVAGPRPRHRRGRSRAPSTAPHPSVAPTTPGVILRRELSAAPWYAPPELQPNAMTILNSLSTGRGRRPRAVREDTPATATATPSTLPVEELDSGLRLYDGDTLPPRYTEA